MDNRIKRLSEVLVHYSCRVKQGEKILIEARGKGTEPLLRQLVKEVYAAGGVPFVNTYMPTVERELLLGATEEQLKLLAKRDLALMNEMDAYITVRAGENANENSDVASERLRLYTKEYLRTVHYESRLLKTKWVVTIYPTPSNAQLAGMSSEAFEDYYFNVCTLDYAKMDEAMEPLKKLMERTDRVRVTGKDTELSFSIKNIPVKKCSGRFNIPDGEIYTAPVKDSVNGYITYNTPSVHEGFTYENIRLEFKDGKIVNAVANDTVRLNHVLDSDEGARYIGEFAIGVNPYITKPMKNTLFDEKIMGSIHFTPGNSYEDADNGNKSSVHWDLVFIQTPEFGGGEIYFDDALIRKDGRFVLPELDCLNPENLV